MYCILPFSIVMSKESTARERVKTDATNVVGQPLSNGDLEQKLQNRRDRQQLVLWRSPLQTLCYFILELSVLLRDYGSRIIRHKRMLAALSLFTFTLYLVYNINGFHQLYVLSFRKQFIWCAYWVGLGILSSVGLGTGLHTFVLYLGPHIAAVTLAAFECMSVDFPEPPYPDDIICPEIEGETMSLLTIMSKVRLEAFMWGAGTAIGELPPYFMARTSRLSGQFDEEEQELEELLEGRESRELTILDKVKIFVHDFIQRVGFMGILLCASVPNPLFDLAGITCGHFLIPFWTFFGATLIGKAIIKMHIQKLFIIFVFSERHVEKVIRLIKMIPHFGPSLQVPFKEYLRKQKTKLHHAKGSSVPGETSMLSWIFEKVVMLMVAYFVMSIINSMAQSYHRRVNENSQSKKSTKE